MRLLPPGGSGEGFVNLAELDSYRKHLRDGIMSIEKSPGTIGFLGFGNMGGAVARGVVAAGIVPAVNILVHDPAFAPEALAAQGFTRAGSAEDVFRTADVVLMAVKPQVFKE